MKKTMKSLALLLALVVGLSAASIVLAEEGDVLLTDEPVLEVADEPAEEATEAEEPQTNVRVVLIHDGELCYGDLVTLVAVVENADAADGIIRWETSEAADAGNAGAWMQVSTGTSYSFVVDEQNAWLAYRAVVDGTAASDAFRLPEMTVREEASEPVEIPEVVDDSEPVETTEEPVDEAEQLPESDPETENELEAESEPEIEPESEPENEPETAPEIEPEPEAMPESEPEEESAAALDPNRSISIYADCGEGELHYGDDVVLYATLTGYDNAVYTLQWQTSTDGVAWDDVPGAVGTTLVTTVTEENHLNYWRVVVTVTDITSL